MSMSQLQLLIEHHALELLSASIIIIAITLITSSRRGPPSIWDPIPFVFNTIQFIRNNEKFMKRAENALKDNTVVKFHLGPTPAYLVARPKNIQAIFRNSQFIHNEGSMVSITLPVLYRMTKEEIKRFAADKSGRGKNPFPGTENTPKNERYFYGFEHVHTEYLGRTQYLTPLVEHFQDQLSRALEGYSSQEWTTVSIMDFCKQDVTKCAVHTLLGPKVLELNPGFLDSLWDFDDVLFQLAMGFPKWINSRPYEVQDQYLAAVQKYLDSAWTNFDWDGPSATSYWEPHFGAQVSRELVMWLKESGFNGPNTGAGAIATLVWAQNSNTTPSIMWTLMEIIKDPSLLQAVREEVVTAYVTSPETGLRSLDAQKLVTLPLLTSIYTETLRMRVNFNLIRHVSKPVVMDGYTIPTGAAIQAPMTVAHYDESIWGADQHPASEFWAERHVKYTEDGRRVFALAGSSGSYFPYGGGNTICPGRHFAKHEVMATVALIISNFDIEFLEWTQLDGSPSDRLPRNDPRYCGAGAMPPDRDMRIRWKRIT
ncbi:cytochrome P450 [Hypoxylon trugodes]|uniref:cytochrome P450 n=1 Tax=Hypoxylon trugodes TaxID=326681 RepID=UPI00219E5204|nr:cytochrome P450 [Hypoxylon trugodes]KAI1390114.1 cytochrome P450 [Hypoxylon trugodes]